MGVLMFLPIFIGVSAMIGAVLLRAGVSLANKTLGPPSDARPQTDPPVPSNPAESVASQIEDPQTGNAYAGAVYTAELAAGSEQPVQEANPFATPGVAATSAIPSTDPRQQKTAIPAPNFGKALGIAAVQMIVTFGAGTLVENITQGQLKGIVPLIFTTLIPVALYRLMLPTSFGKAALVYVFQVLIVFLIVIPLAAIMTAIRLFTMG